MAVKNDLENGGKWKNLENSGEKMRPENGSKKRTYK